MGFLDGLRRANALLGAPFAQVLRAQFGQLADELHVAAVRSSLDPPGPIVSEITKLAQALLVLEPQLRRTLLKHTPAVAATQLLLAASSAVSACAAASVRLSQHDSVHVARHVLPCAALLLNCGRLALRPSRAGQPLPGGLEEELAASQLLVASKLLRLAGFAHGQPGFGACIAAAFPPDDTLRWLGAVTDALAAALDRCADGSAPRFLTLDLLADYASVCHGLLLSGAAEEGELQLHEPWRKGQQGPDFPALQAAVGRDSGLQRCIVQFVWRSVGAAVHFEGQAGGLPADWLHCLSKCAGATDAACLRAGRRHFVSRGLGRADQLAANVLTALPTDGLASSSSSEEVEEGRLYMLACLWLRAGRLLEDALQARLGPPPDASGARASESEQEAARLLWPLLPGLEAVRRAVEGERLEELAAELDKLANAWMPRTVAVGTADSPSDLQLFLEAATAALRASMPFQPLIRRGPAGDEHTASFWALRLWLQCTDASEALCSRHAGRPDAEAASAAEEHELTALDEEELAALAPAARLLHVTSCRMLHHMANTGTQPSVLQALLLTVASSVRVVVMLQGMAASAAHTQRHRDKAQRGAIAACAAAADLYLHLAESASVPDMLTGMPSEALGHVDLLATVLSRADCMVRAQPRLVEHLTAALPAAFSAAEGNTASVSRLAMSLSECMAAEPLLVGSALHSLDFDSSLGRLLTLQGLRLSGDEFESFRAPLKAYLEAVNALQAAGVTQGSAFGAALEAAGRLVLRASNAQDGLQTSHAQLGTAACAAGRQEAGSAVAAEQRFGGGQAGGRAAEPDPEAALQLAAAAATRCCAHLRCPNVGAAGGADAGQGEGAKLCAACRVAWFCSPACQKLAWRQGGHKQMCQLFAQAKQQEREQRHQLQDHV